MTCGASATSCAPGWLDVGFEVFKPAGTYFVTTDVRPLGYDDGVDILPRPA